MKKIFLILGLLSIVACKDDQKVYFVGNKAQEVFVQQYQENNLENIKARLIYPAEKNLFADLLTGDAQYLADYNERYGVNYKLLPADKYNVDEIIVFGKGERETPIRITIKNLIFDNDEVYALPLQIVNRKSIQAIEGQEHLLLVIRPNRYSKVLKMGTNSVTSTEILSSSNVFQQWSFETTVYVESLTGEIPIVGLNKNTANPLEIVFKNGQLQAQLNAVTALEIPTTAFAPQVNKWYALSFTYDGNTLRAFVNGKPIATQLLQGGALQLRNLYIAGSNQRLRELRFWRRALTQQELKVNLWHTLPTNKDLQLYLPLNGKKIDFNTKVVTDDETQLWDWSSYGMPTISLPSGASFDSATGNGYRFPPEN